VKVKREKEVQHIFFSLKNFSIFFSQKKFNNYNKRKKEVKKNTSPIFWASFFLANVLFHGPIFLVKTSPTLSWLGCNWAHKAGPLGH
jgi:hypothetical protein